MSSARRYRESLNAAEFVETRGSRRGRDLPIASDFIEMQSMRHGAYDREDVYDIVDARRARPGSDDAPIADYGEAVEHAPDNRMSQWIRRNMLGTYSEELVSFVVMIIVFLSFIIFFNVVAFMYAYEAYRTDLN